MMGGRGKQESHARVRSLAEERAMRDTKRFSNDALMALVRREGRVRITLEELQALKAGAGLSIEASDAGLLLTYCEPGSEPAAG